jgi:hypothetical protein
MSERELRFAELDSRRPIGSAVVGELSPGRELLHRPDFLVTDNGSSVAIEVELTRRRRGGSSNWSGPGGALDT